MSRSAAARPGRFCALALCGFLIAACAVPVTYPSGPRTEPPHFMMDWFVAADGIRMTTRRWTPEDGKPKAVVVALHDDVRPLAAAAEAARRADRDLRRHLLQRGAPGGWLQNPGTSAPQHSHVAADRGAAGRRRLLRRSF